MGGCVGCGMWVVGRWWWWGGGGVVGLSHRTLCWHPVPITDRRRLCRPAGVAHAMHCDVEEEERRGQWKLTEKQKEGKKSGEPWWSTWGESGGPCC